MKLKKVVRYVLIFLFLGTLVLLYLAQQNTIKIYGGKTELVNYNDFRQEQKSFCIENVFLLSEDGESFIPKQKICIDKGTIVSTDSSFQAPSEWQAIDGSGKYLIPGLIDSHIHLFKSQNDLLLYLANGITEIREMIGEEDHLKWRNEIQAGRPGPDMFIASPRLGSFGWLEGWFMEVTQGYNNIRDAKEAEEYVNRYAELGYDAVKIYSFLNKEAYEAVNKFAVEKGLKVVGHIPFDLDLEDIWTSNQTEIAHVEELMNAFRREYGRFESQEEADDFLAFVNRRAKEVSPMLKENKISVTTTIWLTQSFVRQKFELDKVLKEVELEYENPGISEWDERIPGGLGWLPHINRYKMQEGLNEEERAAQKIWWYTYGYACQVILKSLHEEGVSIIAGTDANLPPTVPGFSLHDELKAMQEAGMSTAAVLKSATAIAAQWLGSNTGVLSEGYKANLLLLDNNPLLDITHTKSINTLIINGKVYERAKLDQILEAVKAANDKSRARDISSFISTNQKKLDKMEVDEKRMSLNFLLHLFPLKLEIH
ncbi:MAG: amidohydrolase family protein [Bacteroidota bacterium]